MSIVEKALHKLQAGAAATERTAPAHVPPAHAVVSVPTPVRREPPPSEPVLAALEVRDEVAFDAAAFQKEGMLPPDSHRARLRDQFRRVKWAALETMRAFEGGEGLPRFMVVTSAVPREGKTFAALNLALSIARERDYQVVLVDADLSKAHLTQMFGLKGAPGLLDLLGSPNMPLSGALVSTTVERLYVLPSGTYVNNAPELLASRRMEQVASELDAKGNGTVVVVDTSPVLATNEALALARLAGQILMVVRADNTLQSDVLMAIDHLGRDRVRCVLNQATPLAGETAYSHYGNYYGNTNGE